MKMCGILFLERLRGIEPPSSAWEAGILPMNHSRLHALLYPKGKIKSSCSLAVVDFIRIHIML